MTMSHNKTTPPASPQQLAELVDEALALMEPLPSSPSAELLPADAVSPRFFSHCVDLCRRPDQQSTEPIRTIHHLSCTGGTLIAKCVASMPNVVILNEVDPLSTLPPASARPRFTPTDLTALVRQGAPWIGNDVLASVFMSGLTFLKSYFDSIGMRLVLRDHSHSQFLVDQSSTSRPTLLAMLNEQFTTAALVTVRDPIDSFLALEASRFRTFSPLTFSGYCSRYASFLDAHAGIPLIKYEDFVEEPQQVMSDVCGHLEIQFSESFVDTLDTLQLSGDSGRTGNRIERRSRRPYPNEFAESARQSASYLELIERLSYDSI